MKLAQRMQTAIHIRPDLYTNTCAGVSAGMVFGSGSCGGVYSRVDGWGKADFGPIRCCPMADSKGERASAPPDSPWPSA